MINIGEVIETNDMVEKENLDVRTITLGISLLDCIDSDLAKVNENIYNKITTLAKNLVSTGKEIENNYCIPIVNKRISVTPIALVGGAACKSSEDFVTIAKTLDRAAKEVGVNFIGGYSALVSKGMTKADELLIKSIPQAMLETDLVCSSVNVGSTKTGINMDAVKLIGEMIKETAEVTKHLPVSGCAKFVVFCNAPDDNPFMAGAFHGVTEADAIINTIPALVITKKEIDLLHEDAVVLDIASAPGGCDSAYCKEKHVPYKLALGLPGLYCPKTSAMILLEAMPFGYKPDREKWKS